MLEMQWAADNLGAIDLIGRFVSASSFYPVFTFSVLFAPAGK
jgi:hypothetical protein